MDAALDGFRCQLLELDDVEQLTKDLLISTLTANKEFLKEHGVEEIIRLTALYFENSDHGFEHSKQVWQRCQEIIKRSVDLWRLAQNTVSPNYKLDCRKVLMWAAVFHDFSRFYKVSPRQHEAESAKLAFQIFNGSPLAKILNDAICRHDYFCELIDGEPLPFILMNPLAEIFRLADKTSISPQEEIARYYQTGKQYGTPFLKPKLTYEVRFNLTHNQNERDMITWFLLIFALQASDFVFRETAAIYNEWAKGKPNALDKIIELAKQEQAPVEPEKIRQIILCFCAQYHLVLRS